MLPRNLWRIYADPNALEVALINLATNARDAGSACAKRTRCRCDRACSSVTASRAGPYGRMNGSGSVAT